MIGFVLGLLFGGDEGDSSSRSSDVGVSDSSGRTSRSAAGRGPLAEQAFQQGREVLRADIRALESGAGLPVIPEPSRAEAMGRSGRGPTWRRILVLFLVAWLVSTLVVLSWSSETPTSTDGALDTIGTVLGWAMILLMSLVGALLVTFFGVAIWSAVTDGRATAAAGEQQAARLRRDFWIERESLRVRLGDGSVTTEQLVAMLRGVGEEPPSLIAEMVRPERQAER